MNSYINKLLKNIRRERISLVNTSHSARTLERIDLCLDALQTNWTITDAMFARTLAKCSELSNLVSSMRAASEKSGLLTLQSINGFLDAEWDQALSENIAGEIEQLVNNVCRLTTNIAEISARIAKFNHVDEAEKLTGELEDITEQTFGVIRRYSVKNK